MIRLSGLRASVSGIRPLRNLGKGDEESAAHSDSLGNSRKLGSSPPCGFIASPCKLELFSIYLDLSRVTQCLFRPITECIVTHFIAGSLSSTLKRLNLGPTDQQA